MESRIRRGACVLAVEPGQLPEAVCQFAGTPPPDNTPARHLLTGAFQVLDQAPAGVLWIGDLSHTAEDWPALPVTVSRMPWQAATLVDDLAELLAALPAGRLRDAARGFGLRRAELAWALHTVDRAAGPPADDDADRPFPLADEGPSVWERRRERQATLLSALAATAPSDWTGDQHHAVIKTLLRRLAGAGDALLRLSEHDPAPLPWVRHGGGRTADRRVPGSANILHAQLRPAPNDDLPDGPDDQALWGSTPPRSQPWRWQVGWYLPGGRFTEHDGSHEATAQAAAFAAEQTVAAMLRCADTVRQRFTGRLLVPRSTTRPQPGDPAIVVVTLRSVLLAVFNTARDGAESAPFAPVPHTEPDHRLGSLTAAILDQLGLPCPGPAEPANTCDAGTEEFRRFLACDAVILTPPARTYLAGLDDVGPGPAPLADRHAAGLRAVLNTGGTENADRLAADLGPLPDTVTWLDLLNPHALQALFDEP